MLLFTFANAADVKLVYPENGKSVDYATFTFNSTLSSPATCSLHVNNVLSGTFDAQPNQLSGGMANHTLAEGIVHWYVICDDGTTKQQSATWTFTLVKNIAAGALALTYPPNGQWTNYPAFVFTHTLGSPATCSLNVGGISCGTDEDVEPKPHTMMPDCTIPEGDFLKWNVSCNDGAATQKSATWTFAVDQDPPIVTASATDSKTTEVLFQISANDNADGNLNCSIVVNNETAKEFLVSFNQQSYIIDYAISPLSGANQWYVTCRDEANNPAATQPDTVSAEDTTPPSIYLSFPDNGSIVNTIEPQMQFVVYDNSSLSYCTVSIDGIWTGQILNVSTSAEGKAGSFKATNLTVGNHTWHVSCSDKLSNPGKSSTASFTVDPTLPMSITDTPSVIIQSPDPTYIYVPKIPPLAYIPYDSKHNNVSCTVYVDGTNVDERTAYNGIASTVSLDSTGHENFVKEGKHEWTVRCTDGAGNTGNSKTAVYVVSLTSVLLQPEQPLIFVMSENLLLWSGIVIGIAALLLGIMYMSSKVFLVPAWEAWVKEEFGNLLYTAFLLLAFTMFAGVMEFASDQLARDILFTSSTNSWWTYNGGTGRWYSGAAVSCSYPCHFYIARALLGSIYEKYNDSITSTAKVYSASRLAESLGIGANLNLIPWFSRFDIGFGVPIYPGRAVFNNSLSKALGELLNLAGIIKAQEIALAYLPGLSGAFFVAGVLFRIPWFTRKLGGLLIALGIGVYAILPLVYVIGWYTIDRSNVMFNENQLNEDLTSIEAGTFGKMGGSFGGGTSVDSLFTKYDGSGKEEPQRLGLLDMVGRGYLLNTWIPLLAVFATIGFVRRFSPMIGGDVEIPGLTHLI